MKFTAATIAFLSGAIATPIDVPSQAPGAAAGFIAPSVFKIHNVNTNANFPGVDFATVQRGPPVTPFEATTLYEFNIPAGLKGMMCVVTLAIDDIAAGTHLTPNAKIDVFTTGITNLATQNSGNIRQNSQGRLKSSAANGPVFIVDNDIFPQTAVVKFPCPAGKTLEYELVSVGETFQATFKQDTSTTILALRPLGLSVAYFL